MQTALLLQLPCKKGTMKRSPLLKEIIFILFYVQEYFVYMCVCADAHQIP